MAGQLQDMAKQLYNPPAPQPVAQADIPKPTLLQGVVQNCEGYLGRQSKILKRWKKEWLQVVAGEWLGDNAVQVEGGS